MLCALRAVFSVHWQKNTGKRFDVVPQRELFESTVAGGALKNILNQPLRGPSHNHQRNIQNIFISYAFNSDSSRFLLTLDGDSYYSKHVIVYELYMKLFLSLGSRSVQLQTFT